MRKSILALVALVGLLSLGACNDYETFGEKKDQQRKAISRFIADSAFQIIDEAQFHRQGDLTQGSKQFVLLEKSGVYMQIVRQGCGERVKDGESMDVLCRFLERNIEDSTVVLYNAYIDVYNVDKMHISKTGSTITASFTSGVMYQNYGASVPSGWLVPLDYVNIGRLAADGDELAKVRLIVPHSQGNSTALQYVIPYYYEITFERGR